METAVDPSCDPRGLRVRNTDAGHVRVEVTLNPADAALVLAAIDRVRDELRDVTTTTARSAETRPRDVDRTIPGRLDGLIALAERTMAPALQAVAPPPPAQSRRWSFIWIARRWVQTAHGRHTWKTEPASPRRRSGARAATARSWPWRRAIPAKCWISAAKRALFHQRSAVRSRPAIVAAASRCARTSASSTRITSATGCTAAPPASTTWFSCAASTIASSTKAASRCLSWPAASRISSIRAVARSEPFPTFRVRCLDRRSAVTPDINLCGWHGEPVDYDEAVDAMCAASA